MDDDKNIENSEKKGSTFGEFLRYAIIAMLIVVPFRIYIAQPYIVSGSSMDPTFKDGDYLIVDQLSKRFSLPERNSVLIIKYPLNTKKFFIKRLIAFPNEQVSIKDGVVTVINEQNPEGVVIDSSFVAFEKKDNFYLELGENEFFVMGDNRAGSSDSRIWGPLPKENIVGKPILRLLPVNNISINPGLIYTK
jgi:signal peptidase I